MGRTLQEFTIRLVLISGAIALAAGFIAWIVALATSRRKRSSRAVRTAALVGSILGNSPHTPAAAILLDDLLACPFPT
jgi:uncharacterized protein YqgC (DUF456 family)